MSQETILEKVGSKFESMLDTLEDKPIESIIKVVLMYVVFKQLFKSKSEKTEAK